MSWNPVIATLRFSNGIGCVAWSPCNRFIAVASQGGEIQILDAVTLKQLKSVTLPQGPHSISSSQLLVFSPKSHVLTCLGRLEQGNGRSETLMSWDLQTGIPLSKITMEKSFHKQAISITYSGCGTMVGVLIDELKQSNHRTPTIYTYNVLSGRCIHHHIIEGLSARTIWTQGECVRFATLEVQSITIWEIGFTLNHQLMEVESLSTPDNFDPCQTSIFIPTPSLISFNFKGSLQVWDARHSKLLLGSVDIFGRRLGSFSPDGHFFACSTRRGTYSLWENTPTGYVLHQELTLSNSFGGGLSVPQNGQFIAVYDFTTLCLWDTKNPTTSPSIALTQHAGTTDKYILEFSPDGLLAAVTQPPDDVVVVLNLKSGTPRLTIDAGMHIYGLKLTKSSLLVVGNGEIITWNLPAGDHILNSRANIDNSAQTTFFHCWGDHPLEFASISPNFNNIAIQSSSNAWPRTSLRIYDTFTGRLIAGVVAPILRPWFTPDGHEVWSSNVKHGGWAIMKDSNSNVTKLKCLDPSCAPSGEFPWQSSHGHKVTDGWILSSSRKRLLWLPHQWRSYETNRVWGGWFLGLIHSGLPEAVILELPKE